MLSIAPVQAWEVFDIPFVGVETQMDSYVHQGASLAVQGWPEYELKEPPRWTWGSCIQSAKYMTGREGQIFGNAWDIQPDTDDPLEARYLLTTEGNQGGHLVVIASQDAINWYVQECNYKPDQCQNRTIPKDADFIRGMKK